MPQQITMDEAYGAAPIPSSPRPTANTVSLDDAYALGAEPIGAVRAVGQGLVRGGIDALGLLASAPDAMGPAPGLIRGAAAAIGGDPRAFTSGSRARQVFESLIGPYLSKPGTENERTLETVARSATIGVPMALASGGVAPVVGAITGPVSAEIARRTGNSMPVEIGGRIVPVGEIAANVIGGGAPGWAAMGAARLPGVSAAASRVGRAVSPSMRREAAEIAAGKALQSSIGPDDAVAVGRLSDEVAGMNGPGRASTAQVLMDDAPGVMALEGGVARDAGALNARLSRLREQSGAELRQAGDTAFRGAPAAAQTGLVRLRSAAKAEADALYDAIDDAAIGSVPFDRVRATAAEIVEDAGDYGRKAVPGVVRTVLRGDENVGTFQKLRQLRVAVNDRLRTVSKAVARGGENASAQEQRHLQRLKESVDDTFRSLEGAGGEAAEQLRTANAAYARYQDTYSRAHPTIRKLLDNEDPGDAIRALTGRGTARPSDEARRLVRALEGDPDALEGLRRVFVEEAFDGAVGDGTANRALRFLEEHARPAQIILGDDGYATARQLAERLRQTTYGRAGTAGFSQGTGSAYREMGESLDQATGAVELLVAGPVGAAANAATRSAVTWLRDNATREMQQQILVDALVDPKIARDLLMKVRAENLASWQSKMAKHFTRSAERSAVTTAAQEK